MRFLLKLIMIAILFGVLYYFFGPQIDAIALDAKTSFMNFVSSHGNEEDKNNTQEPKYYQLPKRD